MSVVMGCGGMYCVMRCGWGIIFYTSCPGDEGPLVINFIFTKARLLDPMVCVCVCVCVNECKHRVSMPINHGTLWLVLHLLFSEIEATRALTLWCLFSAQPCWCHCSFIMFFLILITIIFDSLYKEINFDS